MIISIADVQITEAIGGYTPGVTERGIQCGSAVADEII
jgi:hypothetical protein